MRKIAAFRLGTRYDKDIIYNDVALRKKNLWYIDGSIIIIFILVIKISVFWLYCFFILEICKTTPIFSMRLVNLFVFFIFCFYGYVLFNHYYIDYYIIFHL